MSKPDQIRIDIASPCSEDWNKMTPCEQGRYCSRCQKQVIDFTTWSDAALYNFFAARPQNVCGRLLPSQMQRPIHIPPQPHSRLYRMVVALGLCIVAAAPVTAQSKPPMKNDTLLVATSAIEDQKELTASILRGKVVDDKKEPLLAATIQVFQNGKLVGGNISDFDGDYIVTPLEPGYYDVVCSYTGYDSMTITKLLVQSGAITAQNFNLNRRTNYEPVMIIAGKIAYTGSISSNFSTPERISDKKLQKERERKERKAARKNKKNNDGL